MNKFDRVREQIAVFETRNQWPLSPGDTALIEQSLMHYPYFKRWAKLWCMATLVVSTVLYFYTLHELKPSALTTADMVAAPGAAVHQ